MIRFNTGYGNKTGAEFNSGRENISGMGNITGIEFKTGY